MVLSSGDRVLAEAESTAHAHGPGGGRFSHASERSRKARARSRIGQTDLRLREERCLYLSAAVSTVAR